MKRNREDNDLKMSRQNKALKQTCKSTANVLKVGLNDHDYCNISHGDSKPSTSKNASKNISKALSNNHDYYNSDISNLTRANANTSNCHQTYCNELDQPLTSKGAITETDTHISKDH